MSKIDFSGPEHCNIREETAFTPSQWYTMKTHAENSGLSKRAFIRMAVIQLCNKLTREQLLLRDTGLSAED